MNRQYNMGSVVFSNWVIVDEIGEGSFGKVFEIQRKDDFTMDSSALKVITVPHDPSEMRSLIESGKTQEQAKRYLYKIVEGIVNEIKIMSKLKATGNVVSYEDHEIIPHEDGMGWDILIRMELLHPLLPYACDHPFSRRDIIKLGIDMCKALELCQKYNIIHRDIKPENIFISDNGDFKLGDFGIARTIEKSSSELTKTGTYNYMAPEVFRGDDYGFSVDIYSLGVVLYRLLNKNRTPFLPESPKEITPKDQEEAQIKRMRGDTVPLPFYSEGRLPEIVLKACAPSPIDRYSSPMQMRQELEAILYDANDSALIYPDGDTLEILRNYYVSLKKKATESIQDDHNTESAFSSGRLQAGVSQAVEGTESAFGKHRRSADVSDQGEKTESAFSRRHKETPKKQRTSPAKKPVAKQGGKGKRIGLIVVVILLAMGFTGYLTHHNSQVKAKEKARTEARYQELMTQGMEIVESDPEQAQQDFLEAQKIHPEESSPLTAYAYALYTGGNYSDCVTYIEDELGLGKDFDVDVQNQLSEILGAAYFELDDYAAAASFFRLSTAGGDITVSAMRDYAVSLGRLGDIEAADEVLQKMYDAGASGDVTDYVQAEVDFALKDYLAAESGFRAVLDSTDDLVLQKRALRSLAEVYRDCSGLVRVDSSPISNPTTKEAELLADGIERYGLRYDSTLWEMLALAYFEAYHTDTSVSVNYLTRAAECFNRVIELGVQKDYLYSNLYTIYYELERYDDAEQALQDYEAAFPDDYMPHALRGMMLITIENNKSQSERNYATAKQEFETAGSMIRSSDDATYYQQLGSLIQQLENEGWL
jgi:serine/threonine protein kinase